MTPYSTRQLAALLGMQPARIRALARAALIRPSRTARGHLRFSFQDLVLLRTAKGLLSGRNSTRRLRRAMRSLGVQLGGGKALCSIRIRLEGSDLLASSGRTTWLAESGQTLFDFSHVPPGGNVESLAARTEARSARTEPSAEEWFELAIALEQTGAATDAETAYRRAFEVEPSHVGARINLGRLRHAAAALEEARDLYRQALEIDPAHPIAHFNLAIVLEDCGRTDDAMRTYLHALALDPKLKEAHYNLARLYELRGEDAAALRHLAAFKRLKGH